MDPVAISSIISGATALVVAIGGYLTSRTRRISRDIDAMEAQLGDAYAHMFKLELLWRGEGKEPPARPASLRLGSDGGRR